LEAPPTANVVDQDCAEVSIAVLYIMYQLQESISTVNSKSALASIREGPHDGHAPTLSVLTDDFLLVLRGILLVLG
jgi:hypothetical protein